MYSKSSLSNINVNKVVKQLAPLNNVYRDSKSPTRIKLKAMWKMGDVLFKHGVKKPHSFGWTVQSETKGLIKRPTVFRSYKVRRIWEMEKDLLNDLGKIKSVSYFTDMLPILDPDQEVRKKISSKALQEIFRHSERDSSPAFKKYISKIKRQYSHDRLGRSLDKSKHLRGMNEIVVKFKSFLNYLNGLINDDDMGKRDGFRSLVLSEELQALSNMCLSLTTKDNHRLYNRSVNSESSSKHPELAYLYSKFKDLLDKKSDESRARLRRLIAADIFADMSDMLSSMISEESVADYRSRKKMSMRL